MPAPGDLPRVLIVEDTEDDLDLAQMALARSGVPHQLAIARDGREAIAALIPQVGTNPPRVVLLDLKLPFVDGKEVLHRLRQDELGRLTPVVVLTSSSELRDAADAYKLGANCVVRKPVEAGTYFSAMALLARYWVEVNAAPEPGLGSPLREPHEGRPMAAILHPPGVRLAPTLGARTVAIVGDTALREGLWTGIARALPTARLVEVDRPEDVRAYVARPGVCGHGEGVACPSLLIFGTDMADADWRGFQHAIRTVADHRLRVVVVAADHAAQDVSDAYALRAGSVVRRPPDAQGLHDLGALLARYWLELSLPVPLMAHAPA